LIHFYKRKMYKMNLILVCALFSIKVCESQRQYEDLRRFYPSLYDTSENEVESRTAGLTIDSNTVYTGILQPENVLIHVAQNLVNFVASSVTWAFVVYAYSGTAIGRKRRSADDLDEVEDAWSLGLDGDNVAWLLRQMANTAEKYKRLDDEL